MKGNKLPRKRKKRMIKEEGLLAYIASQVNNKYRFEEKGLKPKFPKLKVVNNRVVTIKFY